MLLIRDFNRRFTLRRLAMFGSPTVKPVSALTFPKGSVLHYFHPESIEVGPPATLYHINDLPKIPRVRHHMELPEEGTVGLPIEIKQDFKTNILSYHRKWKSLGRFKTKALVDADDKILMIENYAPILKRYRYNERVNLWYDIAHNQLNTVIKGLKSSIEEYPNRQHYVPVNLPATLPGKQKLDRMVTTQTKDVWAGIGTYEMLLLTQLYAWVGEEDTRKGSMFNELTPRELKHVNLIFEFKGNFVNINLGEMDGWRKEGKQGKVAPRDMQKRLRETIRTILESPVISVKGRIDPTLGEVVLDDENYDEALDIQEDDESIDKEIERFDSQLKDVKENEDVVINDSVEEVSDEFDDESLDSILRRELEGIRKVSPRRYERFLEKYEAVPTIESPYGGSYENTLVITPEEQVIEDKPFVQDDERFTIQSWNQSRTKEYGKKYCSEVLPKDVVRMVHGAQKLGFIIDAHDMEEKLNVGGHKEEHKLRITLLDGKSATLPFIIPKIDSDGYWTSNGVKNTMRKQRVDQPIRKVGPSEVALTTFYGKVFVQTCEKTVANWGLWATNQIRLADEDNENNNISNVSYINVFDHTAKLPREYSTIAMEVSSFDSNGYHYNFDHTKIDDVFDEKDVERLKKDDLTPVAKARGSVLAMDMSSAMYELKDGKITPAERIGKLIGLPINKEPKEFTEVKVLRKYVPLGIMLAYYWGLENLLKRTKTKYEFIPPGEKVSGEGIVLQLKEGRVEIHPKSRYEELIYNCFLRYKDQIKTLSLRDLNNKEAYPIILQKDKLGNEYITEFDLLERGFVDPLHEEKLKTLGEPTGFKPLLLRANELMDLPHHPKESDIGSQQLLTHQRIAGHIYKESVGAMRRYHNSPPSIRKFDMKPKAVWQAIDGDTSVLGAQEANPIQPIKETDVVTFGGSGGRSRRSMVKHTRIFNKEDLGIISGDTVDSTDVGITALLSNDANIADITGRVNVSDVHDLEHGQLLSFCNSIAPDVDVDDSKRGNFVGIQMGSAQAAKHGKCPPYRTPSMMLVAHRTSDSFATTADRDGKVKDVNEHGITVVFDDGEEVSYPVGRWYGAYEGATYPHDMTTFLKKGEKFKAGAVLTYADNHFERDVMNPTQVNWKAGVMANVVLLNAEEVFEDSDEIDEYMSEQLIYSATKTVEVPVSFGQNIMDIVGQNTKVDYDTTLAIIDDSNDMSGYSENAVAALSEIASSSPKAEVKGYVDKIEVIYNGEYEEMSESVLALARKGDRQRRLQAKHSPKPLPRDGRVDEEYRVKGNPLKEGQMIIKFYITHETAPGGGSKLVVANQMKSVIRGRMVGRNFTDDGEPIHLKFGREGVDNRIVGSLYHIGLKNLFCWGLGKECREMRDR